MQADGALAKAKTSKTTYDIAPIIAHISDKLLPAIRFELTPTSHSVRARLEGACLVGVFPTFEKLQASSSLELLEVA